METNFSSQFARMGIKVDAAELVADDTVEVTSTIAQYQKIESVLANVTLITIRDNRVISEVALDELQAAVEANAKAPRGSGAKCTIATESVYTVETDDDAPNNVTSARWNPREQSGEIVVNGVNLAIHAGQAEDFYEVGEESDPERTVYYVSFVTVAGTEETLTSYGITNLIRRVVAYGESIDS